MGFDRSAQFLLLANLAMIPIAVAQGWALSDMMWVYWGQSVVIGYYNWRRIRSLKKFSTDGVAINGRSVQPTPETRRELAVLFAMHFGLFHLFYSVFLASFTWASGTMTLFTILGMLVCVIIFWANHRFSFRHNLEQDLGRKPHIGTIMLFPYARIVPMHLTIIFGFVFLDPGRGGLILFLGLKTLADVLMHLIEHRQPVLDEKSG